MHQQRWSAYLWTAVVILLLIYLVQIRCPLRLGHPDSWTYLLAAASAANGHGFMIENEKMRIGTPIGYPAVVAAFDLLGLGTTKMLVLFNWLLLCLGVWGCYIVYRTFFHFQQTMTAGLISLVLLSYVFVEEAPVPLTDVFYFGISTFALVCLLLFGRASGRNCILWGILACTMVTASILVRGVGVTFIPALCWAIVAKARSWAARLHPGRQVALDGIIVLLFAAAGTLLVLQLLYSHYHGVSLDEYREVGILSMLRKNLFIHLSAWGHMTLNFPGAKHIPTSVQNIILPIAAIVALIVTSIGFWMRRRDLNPVGVYVVSYMVAVLVWPYYNTRFYLPMIPLFLGYAAIAIMKTGSLRLVRFVVVMYLIGYSAMGIAALGRSTRLALVSQEKFCEEFVLHYPSRGNYLQPTYRVAFGCAHPGDYERVSQPILYLLRRYEPRAQSH